MVVPQGLGPLASLAGPALASAAAASAETTAPIVRLWFVQFYSGTSIVDQVRRILTSMSRTPKRVMQD